MALRQPRLRAVDVWHIANQPEYQSKRLELIEGVLIEVPPSFEPSAIAIQIASAVLTFVRANRLGYVTGADGGYIMDEQTRFIPDVGFISAARLPQKPERDVPVPPDFAVEVVSPTDTQLGTHRKAMQYIQFGTRLVWVVYPDNHTVHVYTPDENGAHVQVVGVADTLKGGDVLKGFTLPVKNIFLDDLV